MRTPDGPADAPTGDEPKARYKCPKGHTSWERVNNHAWCHGCNKARRGDPRVDPEWHELVDTKTGETVPFDELRESWPDFREVPAY
jgi:hypothetical protein